MDNRTRVHRAEARHRAIREGKQLRMRLVDKDGKFLGWILRTSLEQAEKDMKEFALRVELHEADQ